MISNRKINLFEKIICYTFKNKKLLIHALVHPSFLKDNKTSNKRVRMYNEYFFNKEINILDITDNGIADNTQLFNVPENHFFVMGDNRDNSQDSRFISTVGFIPYENLVGKAQFIFFSLENARFLQIWKWPNSIRYERIFQKIQ